MVGMVTLDSYPGGAWRGVRGKPGGGHGRRQRCPTAHE